MQPFFRYEVYVFHLLTYSLTCQCCKVCTCLELFLKQCSPIQSPYSVVKMVMFTRCVSLFLVVPVVRFSYTKNIKILIAFGIIPRVPKVAFGVHSWKHNVYKTHSRAWAVWLPMVTHGTLGIPRTHYVMCIGTVANQ